MLVYFFFSSVLFHYNVLRRRLEPLYPAPRGSTNGVHIRLLSLRLVSRPLIKTIQKLRPCNESFHSKYVTIMTPIRFNL